MSTDPVTLRELSAGEFAAALPRLAVVLHACVQAGAAVNFVLPFELADAEAFWRERILPAARTGDRRVLAAFAGDALAGTVQLSLARQPNQRHRCDVEKLLVHPAYRRCGIARALMLAAEKTARGEGRTLLTLDTVAGGPAESLYQQIGYTLVGRIPRFARATNGRDWDTASLFYKELSSP